MPNMSGPNGHDSIVFMIGLGVCVRKDFKTTWSYYNFRVPELNSEFEYEIFDQMYEKIDEIIEENSQLIEETNIYHWGNIEKSVLNNISKKI